MLRPIHVDQKDDSGTMTKIVAILFVVAALCAVGAYVVYGSGMWNPPVSRTGY